MSKKDTKSARFKVLLPEIYRKLIAENYSHLGASLWLKKEHELDLIGQNIDGKPFSNYLSLYGDIKTAKATYRKVYGKKSVAENWLNDDAAAPKTKARRSPDSTSVEKGVKNTNEVSVKEKESPPVSSVRINEAFRKPQATKAEIPSLDSLMDGFDDNRL